MSTIAKVSVGKVFRGTLPFLVIAAGMLILVIWWPALSLVLVR